MMKAIRNIFFLFVAFLFVLTSCTTSTGLPPTVSTQQLSAVTQTTATGGGTVVSDGGATITARGVCWATTPYPTIKSNFTTDNTGTGSFVSSLTNLFPATTFYVSAYATNANGTGYGTVYQVTTPPDKGSSNNILNPDLNYGTVLDIDGNTYQTIIIGTQTWMAENLAVTKYRNGDAIPNVTYNSQWNTLTTGAQCTYRNTSDSMSIAKFGRLYNFYAVADSRNLAPAGWHIASDAEWTTLMNYLAVNLGTSTSVAQALAAQTDWAESSILKAVGNTSLNNSSGFSSLPIGIRGDYGVFDYVKDYCGWWTSNVNNNTTAWFRSLSYYSITTGKNIYSKQYGLSVRCVKN